MKPGEGTVVIDLPHAEVVLTAAGFYARCKTCPWAGEMVHAKFQARTAASDHVCGPEPACPEHRADGTEPASEQHHSAADHVDAGGNADPAACRCPVYQ